MSAITENGRNSWNVPFKTELQLSDGNIIFVHQNRPNSPVFCPARLYFFLLNTTTIATMNKHSLENKTTEKMGGAQLEIKCLKGYGTVKSLGTTGLHEQG